MIRTPSSCAGTLRYWKWLNNLGGYCERGKRPVRQRREGPACIGGSQPQPGVRLDHAEPPAHQQAGARPRRSSPRTRAYDADPYLTNANVTVWRLFTTSYVLEDAVEAKRWCDEGQRRFPKDFRFAECQLWYYSLKGATPSIDSGWAALERYVELSPPPLRELNRLKGQMRMAVALARAGLADSARREAERSRGDATVDSGRELAQLEALARTILGDKDEAFRQLANFVASNPEQRIGLGNDDSWEWRDLRSDPRFATILGANR